MHSLKNTIVAVMLLAVSYGVYEVITTPDPSLDGEQAQAAVVDPNAPVFPEVTPADKSDPAASWPEFNPNSTGKLGGNGFAADGNASITPRTGSDRDDQRVNGLNDLLQDDEYNFTAKASTGNVVNTPEPAVRNAEPSSMGQFAGNFGQGGFQPADGAVNHSTRPAQPAPNYPLTSAEPARIVALSDAEIDNVWRQADQYVNELKFRAALGALSQLYGQPSVSGLKQQKLFNWLDTLAAKVIYSTENNLFNKPYLVKSGDTLDSIAGEWRVPARLVYNVNQSKIVDPQNLQQRNELKMIKGPFRCEIDISDESLTLFLNNLYAGRFTVQLPPGMTPSHNHIVKKSIDGQQGTGTYLLRLDNNLCIAADKGPSPSSGCVRLSEKDAADVFSILSPNSSVLIRD